MKKLIFLFILVIFSGSILKAQTNEEKFYIPRIYVDQLLLITNFMHVGDQPLLVNFKAFDVTWNVSIDATFSVSVRGQMQLMCTSTGAWNPMAKLVMDHQTNCYSILLNSLHELSGITVTWESENPNLRVVEVVSGYGRTISNINDAQNYRLFEGMTEFGNQEPGNVYINGQVTLNGSKGIEYPLDVKGKGHFSEDLTVDGDLLVKGKITGSDYIQNMNIDNLVVPLSLTVGGGTGWAPEYALQVNTSANINDRLRTNKLIVTGESSFKDKVDFSTRVDIGTPGKVDGNLNIHGFIDATQLNSKSVLSENISVYGLLDATEAVATLGEVTAEKITASKNISTNGNISSNTLNVDLAISTGHLVTDYLTVDKVITTKDLEATGTGHFTGNVAIDGNLQIKGNITGQNFAGLEGNTFTSTQHVQGEGHGFTVGPANFWRRLAISYWGDENTGAGFIFYPENLWFQPQNSTIVGIHLGGTGNVGIGTNCDAKYRLQVDGAIRAQELVIESEWADFVFDKDYKLPSLKEVKAHIDEHNHLPGIPSEKEVRENGIGVAQATTLLLQKLEELTLYAIEQNEIIFEQQKTIESLCSELKSIKEVIKGNEK